MNNYSYEVANEEINKRQINKSKIKNMKGEKIWKTELQIQKK